jgi:transposase
MRKTYPTDLSDQEWAWLKTHLPASKPPGRLRTHTVRDVFVRIFYILKSSCPWRLFSQDVEDLTTFLLGPPSTIISETSD